MKSKKDFWAKKAKFIAKGAIDLCMYMHPRQLSIKHQKKLVYNFKGKRIILIVLEMTGERVYMSNTNCNSKDI